MAIFTPGQYKKSLQDKIKQADSTLPQDAAPFAIKNNTQESFAKQASSYAAKEMQDIRASVQSPRSTATQPTGSVMYTSVHKRMQSFVKNQNGK